MSLRLVSSSFVLALALVASSSAVAAAPTVIRGQSLHISVNSHTKAVCSAVARYSDGTRQVGASKRVRNGKLTWALLVPRTTALGLATWKVQCGSRLAGVGRFVVEAASTTPTVADIPKVIVDKQGFSQRPDKFGGGSSLGFGLFLHNTSDTQDALNVYVVVNMVDANGSLVGSLTRTVPLIASGSTYAFGDSLHLRTQAQVVKLELTVRLGGHQVKSDHQMPEFANVGVFPSTSYPGYVGEVDGEVLNTSPTKILRSTKLSIVLLDHAGNPVGGGVGSVFSAVPVGSRLVFIAKSGFDSASLDQVLSAVISPEPSYVAVL